MEERERTECIPFPFLSPFPFFPFLAWHISTGHEGKEVTGSVLYSAINKSHCGKASMTGHEEK